MCSIIGWIAKHGTAPATAEAEVRHILQALHHRGPDAAHLRECSSTTLLASNRLRITDWANPDADMPLVSADGRYTLVFNGEIYNHLEIREELAGYAFRTHSDTEVILAAYDTWGKDCLARFEGMFAFCIHDARDDTTFVACDPTGQKTVYVYEDEAAWVLASEIEPLITNPYRRKNWNLDGLAEYVAHRFILGSTTHIRQIRKLESGAWLQFSAQGCDSGRFYRVPLGDQTRKDVEAVGQEIGAAVEAACGRTFGLEVPYGLLLSGGIDSTAVLAAAARRGLPMRTFSIGFRVRAGEASTSVLDEFAFSRKLAKLYGTEHTEIVLDEADYCDYLDRWTEIAGEPLGSQEAPCLVKLFESAKPHARVVFCGSGPDEVFDGYSYGKRLAGIAMDTLPEAYFDAFRWMGDVDVARLMPRHDARALTTEKYRQVMALYPEVNDGLQIVQLLHFHGRLRSYEFRQVDSISMRFSIETRSPLIDREIVAKAFDFDPALKQWHGEKGIYKQALEGLVPEFIVQRKKQGFPIPSEIWFSAEFEERAAILRDDDCVLVTSGLVDRDYLDELWLRDEPEIRNIFSRLYTVEKILRRQAAHIG